MEGKMREGAEGYGAGRGGETARSPSAPIYQGYEEEVLTASASLPKLLLAFQKEDNSISRFKERSSSGGMSVIITSRDEVGLVVLDPQNHRLSLLCPLFLFEKKMYFICMSVFACMYVWRSEQGIRSLAT